MSKPAAAAAKPKDLNGKLHNTLVYMKQHWQLYLIFMMPALLLTLIFR